MFSYINKHVGLCIISSDDDDDVDNNNNYNNYYNNTSLENVDKHKVPRTYNLV